MSKTFSADAPVTAKEEDDVKNFLECLRLLRREGGWGTITLTVAKGDIEEIITAVTSKPKKHPGYWDK